MSHTIFRGKKFFENFFNRKFFEIFLIIFSIIFSEFFQYFWEFNNFYNFSQNSIQNTLVNTKIMIISMKKSLILVSNRKKNPPAAGSLSGRLLERRAGLRRPAARGLKGAENTRKIISEIVKNTL